MFLVAIQNIFLRFETFFPSEKVFKCKFIDGSKRFFNCPESFHGLDITLGVTRKPYENPGETDRFCSDDEIIQRNL